jgi:hypothetical protein
MRPPLPDADLIGMPPTPPPQRGSARLMIAMAVSLFATLWLAGWSHAATPLFH